MFTFETLPITGHRNEPLPHTLLKQAHDTRHVGLLFPGVGYTAHMPLLYYPMKALLAMGADVLRIETMYLRERGFDTLAPADKARWVFEDATAACRAALAQRPYQRMTLVGKSLGTLAMAHILTTEEALPQAEAVWLTPLLWNDRLRAQILEAKPRSLFAAGTGDSHYNAGYLAELKEATEGETVVIEGANHSLEIEGDVLQSLHGLERVVRAVVTFLGRH